MIVYWKTKADFRKDVMSNDMENIIHAAYKAATGKSTGMPEILSWRHSLQYMDRAISDNDIPDDVGIAIEYHIPQSSKRVDFILSGKDANNQDTAVLIELKQWQTALLTSKDAVVRTQFKHGSAETAHPSYQAWSYKCLLEDYNQTVNQDNVQLFPCAYLHNYSPDDVITNSFYDEYLQKAPVFLKPDAV
ncbi:MAG: AAA family ATPase, partial [Candidatus Saccharimonadales bacterium]